MMKGRPGAVVSCLTESLGRGFEAASPQILLGEGLPRFFPSPDPTYVGASGTGSTLFIVITPDVSKISVCACQFDRTVA